MTKYEFQRCIVFNEDKLTIGDFAKIYRCKPTDIERLYDELFITGEYFALQKEKREGGYDDELY